jgi:hypothetical protein
MNKLTFKTEVNYCRKERNKLYNALMVLYVINMLKTNLLTLTCI